MRWEMFHGKNIPLFLGRRPLRVPSEYLDSSRAKQYRDRARRRVKLPNGKDIIVEAGARLRSEAHQFAGKSLEEFSAMGLDFEKAVGAGLPQQRLDIGVARIMWSTDFPHTVTRWPHSRQLVEEQFARVADGENR
jgi:hypothetical protein